MGWRQGWPRAVRGALVLLALGAILGPLAALLTQWVAALWSGQDVIALALPNARRLTLLSRSVWYSVGVALAGMVLGVLVAVALWRLPPRGRRMARWVVWPAALIPSYVHSLAWSSVAQGLQRLLVAWGLPRLALRGWFFAGWVQLMALAPFAVGIALLALETLDRDAIDAARPLRPDAAVLARVALPLALPVVAAGGVLLFLLTLTEYGVASLFQVSVYALEVLTEFSASHSPVSALAVALPLLGLATMAALSARRLCPALPQRVTSSAHVWATPPRWPRWLAVAQGMALTLVVAQVVVPLVALLGLASAEPALFETLLAARGEIAYSVAVAALAALASLPIALVLGPAIAQRGSGWGWLFLALPVAVPAPLVGVGLIALWNRPGLDVIYDSSVMPVLASVARFAPLAAVVVAAQWRRIDPALIDVARVLRAGPLQVGLQVIVPLLAPGLVAGAGIVFVLALGELGATLLVAPPGRSTLTLRIYNYLHYGASGDVAGLCLVVLLVALAAGLAAAAAVSLWGRVLPGQEGAAP